MVLTNSLLSLAVLTQLIMLLLASAIATTLLTFGTLWLDYLVAIVLSYETKNNLNNIPGDGDTTNNSNNVTTAHSIYTVDS